jgi:hypothetical protein
MRGIRLLVALVRADAYGSGAFGPQVARAARLLATYARVAFWAVGGCVLGVALGILGSFWLAPEEPLGRLVRIILTGPLGLLGGLAWGLWRERARSSERDAA